MNLGNVQLFTCATAGCNFKSYYFASLKHHINNVHEKFRYKCNQCKYEATTKSDLRRHTDGIHHKIKKHPCLVCDKKFSQAYNAKLHFQEKHLGITRGCKTKIGKLSNESAAVKVCKIISEWTEEDPKIEKEEIREIKKRCKLSRKKKCSRKKISQ